MNNATFAGRLVKDAENRSTQSGDKVTGFTVAVDKYKRDQGADFIDCSMWGDRGEKVSQYLTKGKSVSVSGNITARAYMPKNGGEPKAQMMLNVRELTLLGGRENGDSGQLPDNTGQTPPSGGAGDLDDRIPF